MGPDRCREPHDRTRSARRCRLNGSNQRQVNAVGRDGDAVTWAKIDDHANEHRKQLAAGAEACWLWACGLMYANRQKARDGFIPQAVVAGIYPFKDAAKLVHRLLTLGLWDPAEGGYRIIMGDQCALGSARTDWNIGAYEAVFERDGQACRYCASTTDLTVDHVVPRCQAGSDSLDNLVVACRRCNGRKGGRTPQQAGMVLI
jgi:HNH endonuclease